MITGSIISLLLNKYVLGAISVLIGLIYAYFKGSSNAKAKAEAEEALAERARDARVRAAEAKNQFLEKKGERDNEKVNGSTTIDELLGLWDEIQSAKGKSPDSDKKS